MNQAIQQEPDSTRLPSTWATLATGGNNDLAPFRSQTLVGRPPHNSGPRRSMTLAP